jgi:hypothetical protein
VLLRSGSSEAYSEGAVSTNDLVEVCISQSSYKRLMEQASRENRSVTDLLEESLHQVVEGRTAFYRMAQAMVAMH